MVEKRTRTFTLNETEYAEVQRWRDTHECTPPDPGKLLSGDGAHFTYSFTPGGMGDHVSVTCGWCGQTHGSAIELWPSSAGAFWPTPGPST